MNFRPYGMHNPGRKKPTYSANARKTEEVFNVLSSCTKKVGFFTPPLTLRYLAFIVEVDVEAEVYRGDQFLHGLHRGVVHYPAGREP